MDLDTICVSCTSILSNNSIESTYLKYIHNSVIYI